MARGGYGRLSGGKAVGGTFFGPNKLSFKLADFSFLWAAANCHGPSRGLTNMVWFNNSSPEQVLIYYKIAFLG
jgi:hypothetical protein